jgi:hypothetical protein
MRLCIILPLRIISDILKNTLWVFFFPAVRIVSLVSPLALLNRLWILMAALYILVMKEWDISVLFSDPTVFIKLILKITDEEALLLSNLQKWSYERRSRISNNLIWDLNRNYYIIATCPNHNFHHLTFRIGVSFIVLLFVSCMW